jgi:hypothetical protein
LSLQGNVFSSNKVNITTPSATPIYTFTPQNGGLTLEAKIGIVVAGIVVLMATIGFCIVWNGKRRRRAILAEVQKASGYSEWRAHQLGLQGTPYIGKEPGPSFYDSPQSQRPLKRALSWDQGSPESAQAEKAYFSPYSSNYTSPVSGVESIGHAPLWPLDSKGLGINEPPPRDDIEMANLESRDPREGVWQQSPPPLLQNPGSGKEGHFEADLKNSHAL